MSIPKLPEQFKGITLGYVVPDPDPVDHKDAGLCETYLGTVVTADDEYRAYIKVLDKKSLANELIACVLGKLMEFPVPEGFLLEVKLSDIPQSKKLAKAPEEVHYAFGSKAAEGPSLMRRMNSNWTKAFAFIKNNRFPHWDDMVIFDDWIANADRHPGNLIIEPGGKIWWIDHESSFTESTWVASNLNHSHGYRNQAIGLMKETLAHKEKLGLATRARDLSVVMAELPLHDVATISHAHKLLTPSDLSAIVSFVVDRANCLQPIMQKRLGLPVQETLTLLP